MASGFKEFCGGEEFWNKALLLNNSWPRFTSCFQSTVLVWAPCGWLWVALPFYLGYIASLKQWTTLPVNVFNIARTFFSLALFLLACIELLKAVSDNEHHSVPAAIFVAAGVKAGTFFLLAVLTQVERQRGLITSGVQFTFWLLLLLASIVPLYTRVKLQEYDTDIYKFVIFVLYFVLVLVQLLLLFIPEKTARRGYYQLGIPPSPETQASFPSRVTFSWMNSLLFTGYRKSLEENDLFDLHPRDKSQNIVPAFNKAWLKEIRKVNKVNKKRQRTRRRLRAADVQASADHDERTPLLGRSSPLLGRSTPSVGGGGGAQDDEVRLKKPSLFRVLAGLYGWTLLLSHVWKLLYDLLQFVNPMLLTALIAYVETHGREFQWKGYVYACGFFVVAFLQSCLYQYHFHISMTLGMRIRSAVISAVYKKALTMSNEAKKQSTAGEIVNLMSVDCLRLQDVTGYLYIVWSAPLQISIALYMLYEQLGSSVFAGLAIMILLFPVIGFISNKQRKYQIQQMKLKDSRIKLINEVLNGIKVLKLYAWEPSFQKKISDIRNEELNFLKKIAYLGAFTAFAWITVPYLVTLATFATYILSSTENHLDASKAFVSVSLFNILRIPINALPMCIPLIIQGSVSLVRLGRFLGSDDLDEDSVERDPNMGPAIVVENGTFTWDRTMPTPTLKQINVKIAEGQLVAVVGQVGSGKSSLISAFLGEMNRLEGKVFLKKSVAYVPQEAWIQNATIKDNILFGSEYHRSKYEKVIEACALTPDLDILPARDLTEIGEKGINLSGGQKQRVSLARAVYSNADIYLLDDPLSAVDSHVGKHIFNEVISEKGVLKHKTRVLVTHGIQWLPRTNLVVVLKDGQISEMGSYEELLSHDGPFSAFLKTYLTEEVGSEEEEDPEVQELKSKILERITSDTSLTDDKTDVDLNEKHQTVTRQRKKRKDSKTKDEKSLSAKDKIIQEETSETGQVKLAVFAEYSKAVGGLATLVMFLLFAVYQGGTIGSSIWLSLWADDELLSNVSQANTSAYQHANDTYLGIYALLGLLQAVLMLAFSIVFAVRLVGAARIVHARVLGRVLRAPMSFFDSTPIGRVVNRFSRDVETLDNGLPRTLRMWVMCVFAVLSVVVVVSYSTPIFLVLLVPLGVLYFIIQRFYIPTSRQLKRIESVTRSPIYTHFSESISGAHSIRAYQATRRFIAESSARVDRNLSSYFAGLASNRWLGFYLAFLGNIVVLAAALFAVITDDLPSGIVGLSISYALEITQTLNYAVRMTSDLETNIVSVERLKEYSETTPEAEWEIPEKTPPINWPHDGAVSFYNYHTRYRPGLDLVLKGLNCSIQGGEKIGIVGRTGAGKSSLSVALFRIIEAVGGQITIDGLNIADMGLHDLRSRLTILPQEPVLFSGSLRMNLDPLGHHGDDDLWHALEHCHLKHFVSELPAQLDYECGEGGQNLSVGQRQLLCLGRSLLRKTKILVLDEATAAVDMETDSLIQDTIRTEFKDCTILTIAHRLNTVLDYDRIMVLEQGVIREFDSPANLLADKQSFFYSLARDAGLV